MRDYGAMNTDEVKEEWKVYGNAITVMLLGGSIMSPSSSVVGHQSVM